MTFFWYLCFNEFNYFSDSLQIYSQSIHIPNFSSLNSGTLITSIIKFQLQNLIKIYSLKSTPSLYTFKSYFECDT